MERKVIVDTWEKLSSGDVLNMGSFPRGSFDTIVRDLLIPDQAFSGFETVQSAPGSVTVGIGHLFNEGKVYFNDSQGGTEVDLLSRLPAVTKRIVAITVWGEEKNTSEEPRTFLTDAETRATVSRATPTQNWRWANVAPVSGIEGPDPVAPAIPAGSVVVAWVTLTTLGVESIQRAEDNLAPTLRGVSNAVKDLNAWRLIFGSRLDTLASDLLALAKRIIGLATFEFVRVVTADVARMKDLMKLPTVYTAYDADHYLTTAKSDPLHVDWLALIEEGVRFPPAAITDSQLGLLNSFDELVIDTGQVLLPAWDPVVRITNIGSDAEVSIAQYSFQNIDMVQKLMSRTVTRYGTPFSICTNTQWWQEGTYDWYNFTFNRGGETFQVINELTDIPLQDPNRHGLLRLQQVWQDTVEEPYWDRVVTTYTVSGATIAQSFLNSQDGWLQKINLFFSRVAAGDVTVTICQLTNGMPDVTKIIGKAVVANADIKLATAGNMVPTPVVFSPTFLQKDRYGIIITTPGNHYLWVLKNTNNVSGTFFTSTDGVWFLGDLVTDIAFEMFFCSFRSNFTKVQLNPLQLADGIAAININANTVIPGGCTLFYEIQIAGVWHQLDNVDGGPSAVLNGLPPLVPFRACFLGTDTSQPALGVASNSRSRVWRPRADFKHISAIRTTPSVTTISIDCRLEAWRGAPHHTHICKLLHGAGYTTIRSPDATTTTVAPEDPLNTIIRRYTFTGMGALTTFRFRQEGTTDNVLATFHVAEKIDIDQA
jgi:hypothetical protein